MIFTRRHEQKLAEIKALTFELGHSVSQSLEQLELIKEAQSESLRQAERRVVRAPHHLAAPDRAPAKSAVGDENGAPLLAFVHIPKTAGATAITMLVAAYSKGAVRDAGNYFKNPQRTVTTVTTPRKMEGRVLAGHVPYGVFREHLPPDTRYMTFLREPVDRVLSHYFRHILAKDPRIEKALRRPRARSRSRREEGRTVGLDLLEEALVERRLPQLNNLCTRLLCSHHPPTGDFPASALDDAKENLRRFAFVGIQERFEESLVLLQRMLGLGSIPYEDRHVSSDRPAVDEIPDEQRALIEEHNQLDAELYRFGLGLFEDAVAAADGSFAADVEALRAESKSAREEAWREARFAPVESEGAGATSRVESR